MGNTILNFTNGRYSANEAINNFILGSKAKEFKHKYIDNTTTPCCDIVNKIIYSPVLPSILDSEIDNIIRGKNEHETGHARYTPIVNGMEKWSKLKHNLINALEDQRIEKGLATLSKAFENDLKSLNDFAVDKLNTSWQVNGCNAKVLDESIMALHIKAKGYAPMWQISEQAQQYIDVAQDDYDNWVNADYTTPNGIYTLIDIADKIIAKWEELSNSNNTNNNADGNDDNNTDGNDSNDDNNADGNDDNNTDGNDSNENGNADGNDDNNTDGNDSNENGNDDGNENADENTNSNEKRNNDSNKNNADGNTNSNDSNENGNENTDSNENVKNADKPSNSKSNKNTDTDKPSLDDLCDDQSILDNILNTELEKEFDKMDGEIGDYKAFTDNDQIVKSYQNKYGFEQAKAKIAGATSMLASYLEQSLKTQSRCRNLGNRDKGYLDKRALPMMAKNLTKNIFYTQKQGISLDTTVSILIDESGSMYGDLISGCRSLAIALAETLERLKIKFEILGHTTGYEPNLSSQEKLMFNRIVSMVIYEHKNFNENYQTEKYRLGSMDAHDCNIDGEALLFTFKRAMEQRSNRHIIMVLSDGEPSGARRGGTQHLTDVANYCRKQGVEVYAFGIGTTSPKQYYGEENFIYLSSIKDLNSQFFRQLSNIIINGKMGK